ncbi:hypothetical protein J1N35_043681 [Gossypium stocksii]|uniref:Sulfotransferase n=1 Tax=Gossypium stocksii TaxID=47602 RepID=A0A9D3ZF67_9ROSI|nr:hypothetical protein J1N35_043681 [Gossypium stocksii]
MMVWPLPDHEDKSLFLLLGSWVNQRCEGIRTTLGPCFRVLERSLENLEQMMMKLAQFLGCQFFYAEETNVAVDGILILCSFENLSNFEVTKTGKLAACMEYKVFFRCGEVGDAKNHLTPSMIEKLDQVTKEKRQGYG